MNRNMYQINYNSFLIVWNVHYVNNTVALRVTNKFIKCGDPKCSQIYHKECLKLNTCNICSIFICSSQLMLRKCKDCHRKVVIIVLVIIKSYVKIV